MYTTAPPLPWELVEGVLNTSIQLAHPSHMLPQRGDPAQIYPLVSVAPRTCIPSCTSAALYKLWWIDVDHASRIGLWLLDLMLTISRRSLRPRPLQAGSSGLVHAARIGSIEVLEWWYRVGLICRDADLAEIPEEASRFGKVDVLQWYQQRRRKDMDGACLDSVAAAFEGGWIEVLKWWTQFPSFDQEHGQFAISRSIAKSAAAGPRSVGVLEWLASTQPWGIGSFPSVGQGRAIVEAASAAGNVEVLDWCLDRQAVSWGAAVDSVLGAVIKNGSMSVLGWLKKHVPDRLLLTAKMAEVHVDDLCAQGNVEMLSWWHAHAGNQLKVGTFALDRASRGGHVSVLEFWHSKQLEFVFHDPISAAASTLCMDVLDWWAGSGRIKLSRYGKKLDLISVCKQAIAQSPLSVIQWFVGRGMHLRFPPVAIAYLMQHGHVDVLEYLVDKQIVFELPIKEGMAKYPS